MQRVSVVGNSGSGKSTLARRLAASLGAPHVELDAIFHQPGWQELSRDEFRAAVGEAVGTESWVVDGNYSAVRDLVLARADTVVWLDLPRTVVMRRVVARTLRRVLTRQELWNGNREPFANLYRWDPAKNIIRWAWTRHGVYAQRFADEAKDPGHAHIQFVRLRSPADIDALLQ
jgi:adenylate kinase family enzyme